MVQGLLVCQIRRWISTRICTNKPKETADETADETVRWNNLVVIVRSRTERGLEKEVSVQVSKKFLLNYPISSEKYTYKLKKDSPNSIVLIQVDL